MGNAGQNNAPDLRDKFALCEGGTTDYVMLPDFPLTEEERISWEQYRTALRDITKLEGFPWDGPKSAPWPLPKR